MPLTMEQYARSLKEPALCEQLNIRDLLDNVAVQLSGFLHAYFIWDPRIHHQSPDLEWKRRMKGSQGGSWSLSAMKCIERTRREHEDLLAEFNSLMTGIETTLEVSGLHARRMSHEEIFLEIKRRLNPLANDRLPYRPADQSLVYESARSQMANVNLEDELDDYLKIGGLLYSWITLKDLPDATLPGILRELLRMEFPLVINAEVGLPDQVKVPHGSRDPVLSPGGRASTKHAFTG